MAGDTKKTTIEDYLSHPLATIEYGIRIFPEFFSSLKNLYLCLAEEDNLLHKDALLRNMDRQIEIVDTYFRKIDPLRADQVVSDYKKEREELIATLYRNS